MKLGLSKKLNLLIIGVTVTIIGIFSTYVFFNIADRAKQNINEHLVSVATYTKIYLDFFFSSSVKELNLITSRTQFRKSLTLYNETKDQNHLQTIEKIFNDAYKATDTFHSLTLSTLTGDILFSNDSSNKPIQYKSNIKKFTDLSKTYIPINFPKSEQANKSYISMRSPVIQDGKIIALLYAKINLEPLNEFVNIKKEMEYDTTDAVIVYYRDKDALFLTPVTYDENAALKRTISLNDKRISYNQAKEYPDGAFIRGIDYRGIPVYSYVTYLEKYNIGITIELDVSEMKAIQSKKIGFSLAMLSLLIFLAAILTVLTIRHLLKPLKALHSAIVKQSNNTHKLIQVEKTSNDEFGELADSYNKMIKLIQEQSLIDELTQLHNRKAFRQKMKELIAQFKRYKIPFCMLLFDIDHFKQVNDSYGHQVGDKVLIDLSKELKLHIRETDYIFRFGGEEFVILLSSTKIQNAALFAEKLRGSIEKNINVIKDKTITISIGVAEFHDNDTHDSLVKRADDRLYCAKEQGRNRVISQGC